MVDVGFIDFDSIQESEGFKAIPAGDYTVAILESEARDSSSGKGQHIRFKLQVVDGQYKNRIMSKFVNFKHVNPDTQAIGLREMKEIGLACGHPNYANTSVLHGIPFRVRITVEPGRDGEPSNNVKKILWKETSGASWGGAKAGSTAPAKAEPVAIDDDQVPF